MTPLPLLQQREITRVKVHRFDDFDDIWLEMNENL